MPVCCIFCSTCCGFLVWPLVFSVFLSQAPAWVVFLGRYLRGIALYVGLQCISLFQDVVYSSYLLGASASVLSIVVAVGVREPNYPVQFLFIGTVRLKYVALFMVVLDLLFMTSGNAGGHIAHLGGALAGWWFAAGLQSGHDATKWINGVCDWLVGLAHPVKESPR